MPKTALETHVNLDIAADVRQLILSFLALSTLIKDPSLAYSRSLVALFFNGDLDKPLAALLREATRQLDEDCLQDTPPLFLCLARQDSAETAINTFFQKTVLIKIPGANLFAQDLLGAYKEKFWPSLPHPIQTTAYPIDWDEKRLATSNRLFHDKNRGEQWYTNTYQLACQFTELALIYNINHVVKFAKMLGRDTQHTLIRTLDNQYALERLSLTGKQVIANRLSGEFADTFFKEKHPFAIVLDLKQWTALDMLALAKQQLTFRKAIIQLIATASPIILTLFTADDYLNLVQLNYGRPAFLFNSPIICAPQWLDEKEDTPNPRYLREDQLMDMARQWHDLPALGQLLKHNADFVARIEKVDHLLELVKRLTAETFIDDLSPLPDGQPSALRARIQHITRHQKPPDNLWVRIGNENVLLGQKILSSPDIREELSNDEILNLEICGDFNEALILFKSGRATTFTLSQLNKLRKEWQYPQTNEDRLIYEKIDDLIREKSASIRRQLTLPFIVATVPDDVTTSMHWDYREHTPNYVSPYPVRVIPSTPASPLRWQWTIFDGLLLTGVGCEIAALCLSLSPWLFDVDFSVEVTIPIVTLLCLFAGLACLWQAEKVQQQPETACCYQFFTSILPADTASSSNHRPYQAIQ